MNKKSTHQQPPAPTPEEREMDMIAASMNEAEKRIINGTASSQIITHFLKLGTARARLETAKLEKEVALLEAKAKALEQQATSEKMYEEAISAMKKYSGFGGDET